MLTAARQRRRAHDGDDTWLNEDEPCSQLPLTIESARAICRYPEGGLRIGNHVVDGDDLPWIFASLPDAPSG